MTSRVGQIWETSKGQILLITCSTRRGWKMSHDYLILYSANALRIGRLECSYETVTESWDKSPMQRIA